MNKIYSLKSDSRAIDHIQKITLETKSYGIASENGLFGSKEWWQELENGAIEIHTLEGHISKVYMSGHNDFPEFKIESEGNVTSWALRGNAGLYKEGMSIRLEYILVKNRFNYENLPMLLNVWVQEKNT